MKYIELYFISLYELTNDMAPYLLLGFLIAGILYAYLPQEKMKAYLGGSNIRSAINASLFGVPLPLCSCGVIPTGISFYKNGASKGSTVSFLTSTPQTGVDSILVTYSMLGLPFAIIRPIVAFITGIFGGWVTNKITHSEENTNVSASVENEKISNRFLEIFKYGFFDFLKDIAKWLVIGLLLAALISVLIPDDFFAQYLKNDFLGMLIILVASIPLYVCATSSVPIAAVLLLKGLSPGAALVFLMAGPATNAATITVIGKSMGKKTLYSYLASIISGAIIFGLLIDYVLPAEWFTSAISNLHGEHHLIPLWLQIFSSVLFVGLLINVFIQQILKNRKVKILNNDILPNMGQIKVTVKGMNCNHCKTNVENNLKTIEGITSVSANIDMEEVLIEGESVDLNRVKETVESIGYSYQGEKA